MKDEDAREVLGMVKAATTQFPIGEEVVGFWLNALQPLDAELATKAVLRGVRSWRKFPAWSDFYDIYTAVRRDAEAAAREANDTVDGRRGYAPPEWVLVWSWARNYREPRADRSLPQQDYWADPEDTMTTQEYEALRQEWIAAGSPKGNPLPRQITRT